MHDLTPEPIAHRDLKTGNVCLTDNLDPILMDLGELCCGLCCESQAVDREKVKDEFQVHVPQLNSKSAARKTLKSWKILLLNGAP